MRVVKRTIAHASRKDVIRIYPLGDVHIGAATCDEKRFLATVDEIAADDNAYWIGMGDTCEFIQRSDPRFDAGGLAEWIDLRDIDITAQQRDRFVSFVKPIADKCLGLLKGNHELSIHKHYERAIFDEIVAKVKGLMKEPPDKLGLGFSGWIKLRMERMAPEAQKGNVWAIDIYAHHGYGGGQLAGGKALKLERILGRFDCDLALVGHWHTRETVRSVVMGITRQGKPRERYRVAVGTGSWMRSLQEDAETYGEVRGYAQTAIGCPIIWLNPNLREIRALV